MPSLKTGGGDMRNVLMYQGGGRKERKEIGGG
jgi:hypothetical protein